MTLTVTEENYIKAIYQLQESMGKVSTTLLSEQIKTKPASVTDMLKKLRTKKIVHYQRYKGFTLTASGNKSALTIIRKHRLWEYFLVNKLGFEWDEVHPVAEELEHISSAELVQRLDNYLGRPSFDPHGDPIPDQYGKVRTRKQADLNAIPLKKVTTVSAVGNQSQEMLDLLNQFRIGIGTKLKVTRRFSFDGSVEIKIDKQPATIVSKVIAQNVYCIL